MSQSVIAIRPAAAVSRELIERLDAVIVGPAATPSSVVNDCDWAAYVDDALWQILVALQSAHSTMRDSGGRIVLIMPTIGITGAAELTAYTTVTEGIRAMAKSAARQWRSQGIVVNMVAAPLRMFAPHLDVDSHLTAAAFSADDTLVHSVIESTRFLLRPDVDHLAGETIIVDGGSVMLP